MQEIKSLGNVIWSRQEIKNSIPEFINLYKKKPIKNNQGGMKSPHMFATWFMLKKLNPKYVIESGIWKGQSTWLIENAAPEAEVFSIDLNLKLREFISQKANYYNKDFSGIDWSIISNKESTVLFFDDHQNAVERIKQGKKFGFKHFIFEDNYPASQGDCYSLKKAFQHAGYKPKSDLKTLIKKLLNRTEGVSITPNQFDAKYLRENLDIYYEFPPVFISNKTRWGDLWKEPEYPTPKPLFQNMDYDYLNLLKEEASYYTWICYAKLK